MFTKLTEQRVLGASSFQQEPGQPQLQAPFLVVTRNLQCRVLNANCNSGSLSPFHQVSCSLVRAWSIEGAPEDGPEGKVGGMPDFRTEV